MLELEASKDAIAAEQEKSKKLLDEQANSIALLKSSKRSDSTPPARGDAR